MANVSGPSAPPVQVQGPDPVPAGAPGSNYGISAPGSLGGPPPAADPVVVTRQGNLKWK